MNVALADRIGPDCRARVQDYLRLIDFAYHSTLGLRVTKRRRRRVQDLGCRDRDLLRVRVDVLEGP